MFLGLIITIIGVVFLLQNLGLLPAGAWEIIWPLIVIVIGLSLLTNKTKACNFCWPWWKKRNDS